MRLRAHHERREGPAASTFLAVLALPATALAQPRWHRGSKPQVTVYVEKTRVGATNWSYVKRSGIEWSRSSRIHVIFVKRCPSRYYCVKSPRCARAEIRPAGPP